MPAVTAHVTSSSHHLGFCFFFFDLEDRSWFRHTPLRQQQLITFVPKPARAASCSWSLPCNGSSRPGGGSCWLRSGIKWTVTNGGRLRKEFPEWTRGSKKCSLYVFYFYWPSMDLCWLLTLGSFRGKHEWGGRWSPYYWNSVLLRPDESFRTCFFYYYFFYFPWVGGLEREVLFCFFKSWRTRRVEDYGKEKNNISPWRKNKIKKTSVGVLCVWVFTCL